MIGDYGDPNPRGLPVIEDGVLPELPKEVLEEVVHDAALEAFDGHFYLGVEALVAVIISAFAVLLRNQLLSGAKRLLATVRRKTDTV